MIKILVLLPFLLGVMGKAQGMVFIGSGPNIKGTGNVQYYIIPSSIKGVEGNYYALVQKVELHSSPIFLEKIGNVKHSILTYVIDCNEKQTGLKDVEHYSNNKERLYQSNGTISEAKKNFLPTFGNQNLMGQLVEKTCKYFGY